MGDLTDALTVHQAEAEKMFAGAVMLDENYAREACGWLEPNTIRDPMIRAFWAKVKDGGEASQAATEVNGFFQLAGYMTQAASSSYAPAFANTISADTYLVQSGRTLSDMARAVAGRDVDELRELARGIAENAPAASDAIPCAVDVALEFNVLLDNLSGRSENTGIINLDKATGGLEKQTLTIIAARPSMGKSALGIQFCKWKAEHENKRVLLFSLEMSRMSIWARMACGEIKLAWRDVRAERATPEQMQKLKDKSAELMVRLDDRLLIDDNSKMGTADIWRKVSRYKPDFVVVDHMGLVDCAEVNEVLALGQISRDLKIMAKQFDIPVVALYQLNRGVEARDNKRPSMADIRGSGKIEENADNIFFLFRPDYYDEARTDNQKTSKTELIVAKFRDGIRNIAVNLQYHLDEQWFYPEALR